MTNLRKGTVNELAYITQKQVMETNTVDYNIMQMQMYPLLQDLADCAEAVCRALWGFMVVPHYLLEIRVLKSGK